MSALIKLNKVTPGSVLGIITCGFVAEAQKYDSGVRELKQRGFRVCCPLDPTGESEKSRNIFGSADAETRAKAFMGLIEDPEVSAVIALRGGYGTAQILELLDFDRIAQAAKPVVGYSDLTPLLMAIVERAGIPAIHGAMLVKEFCAAAECSDSRESVDSLISLLSDSDYKPSWTLNVLRSGKGSAPVLAGNLTLLSSLLATPWDMSYDGSILVLEDVNERPYRVHRLLNQLKLAGKLENLAGVVLGRFFDSIETSSPTMDEMFAASLTDVFAGTTYPILSGFDFGHNGKNLSLALGCRARIELNKFSVLDSPLMPE